MVTEFSGTPNDRLASFIELATQNAAKFYYSEHFAGIVRLGGKPKRSPIHPGAAGEGKVGRVHVSEPSMTSRQSEPRIDGLWCRGAGACR